MTWTDWILISAAYAVATGPLLAGAATGILITGLAHHHLCKRLHKGDREDKQ